jgi:PAS domain S-box-containing protein
MKKQNGRDHEPQAEGPADNAFIEKVVRSQAHWQATVDAVRDFIFVVDRDCRIRNANVSFAARYGCHPRELRGRDINELLGFEIPQPEELAADAGTTGAVITKEIMVNESSYVVSVFPARYDDEEVYVYVIKDITELIDLKGKLYHTYKLASLGRLVSGVAHELNNPLTGILGYTEILGLKVKDEAIRRDLDKIYKSAERCRVIIDSLLCFSRQQAPQKNLEYIHELIDKTVELRAYWHRNRKIEVIREYGEDIPLAYIDTQQIQQVVLNILMNAEDAIVESSQVGKIIIKVRYDRDRQRIMVSIADNGMGIPKENIPRIFDPFFTTKAVNKGTGLGLSISYGIVLEHGGSLHVECGEGADTVFNIELPLK